MDAFGSQHVPALRASLEEQVVRALALLDDDLAAEYRYAVQHVPHLVATESRVEDFLRTEEWHVAKAAQRLALYWKTRQDLFGPDRWWRPLTQTGRGAF